MRRNLAQIFALVSAMLIAMSASAQAPAVDAPAACKMEAADKAWLDHTVDQWRLAVQSYGQFVVPANARAIIGSEECVLTSDTALSATQPATWHAVAGKGGIPVVEDFVMPLSATSQAMTVNGQPTFVMSAPSVWRKFNVPGGQIGLDKLMTAVFIHETSHILQQKTYFPANDALIKKYALPESFNDDSLQDRYKSNLDFAESIKAETALLLASADAPDMRDARRLAQQALDRVNARRKRFFVGKDAYLSEAEDVFLTLEGSGQWLGYRWLIDPNGGKVGVAHARARFGSGGGFWSQEQGLALFMAVDRLDGGAWKKTAFGPGGKSGITFLETALALGGAYRP